MSTLNFLTSCRIATRQSGPRAGHHANVFASISGKVPRECWMFYDALDDTQFHLGLRTTTLAVLLESILTNRLQSSHICANTAIRDKHLEKRLFLLFL
jgi:hypothetical protein